MKLESLKRVSGYVYLATPYSKYPAGLEAAYWGACTIAGKLIKHGVPVFCPIAHTHPIADFCEMDPLDHSIWIPADKPMMDGAAALVVALMASWRESYGISIEIEHFRSAGKPVYYLDLESFELSDRAPEPAEV